MKIKALAAVLLTAALLTACAGTPQRPGAGLWHGGRLFVATGNTTGVYYSIGGGYADLISKHVPGYEARAEATNESAENIERVATGDMDIALTTTDLAADAFNGKYYFEGRPQKVVALSRVYKSYVQLVVRGSARISRFADLAGKRVSTGSLGSSSDVIAERIMTENRIDPAKDITRLRLSLPETTRGMLNGSIDAFFFVGGLPTPGIADLLAGAPGTFQILPLNNQLPALANKYGAVYGGAKLPKGAYNTGADIDTVVVGNLVVVSPDMPDQLAHDLTRILFEYQPELGRVHPEGGNYDKGTAPQTAPLPLHPGAERYYNSG